MISSIMLMMASSTHRFKMPLNLELPPPCLPSPAAGERMSPIEAETEWSDMDGLRSGSAPCLLSRVDRRTCALPTRSPDSSGDIGDSLMEGFAGLLGVDNTAACSVAFPPAVLGPSPGAGGSYSGKAGGPDGTESRPDPMWTGAVAVLFGALCAECSTSGLFATAALASEKRLLDGDLSRIKPCVLVRRMTRRVILRVLVCVFRAIRLRTSVN